MAGLDGNERAKITRRQRKVRAKEMRLVSQKTPSDANAIASETSESEQDIPENNSTDDEYSARSTRRPSSITLQIPSRSLSRVTGQVADSRNISVRDHLAIQASLINAGGVNLDQVSMSVATVHRQRKENRKTIYDNIRNSFVKPPFVLVHWDSKLIK